MSHSLEQRGGSQVILSGTVTYATAMHVRAEGLRILAKQGEIQLIIQNDIVFDSALVAVLLCWQRWCTRHNRVFMLMVQSRSVRLLLQAYQVTDLFTYFD